MQWANKCNIVWKNVNSPPIPEYGDSLQCVIDRKAPKLLYNLQKKKKKAMETCVCVYVWGCVCPCHVELHHIMYCLCRPFCKNVFTYYSLFLLGVHWAFVMSKWGVTVNTRGITYFMPFCCNSKTRAVTHIRRSVCFTFHFCSTLHENTCTDFHSTLN